MTASLNRGIFTMLIRGVAMALATVSCRDADAPRPPGDVPPPRTVASAGDTATSTRESARQFAQSFYDWYVPLSNRMPGTAYDSVLQQGTRLFTPTLLEALQRDVDAQRVAAEIVSVVGDYDPFLNAQDPCPRYEARLAEPVGRIWRVAIDAHCPKAPPLPAVLIDLITDGTGWHFDNVRRPDAPTDDLVSQLLAAHATRGATPAGDERPLMIVVLERDVRVQRGSARAELRGVLYSDTTLLLRRGTTLSMIAMAPEGGCRVRVDASTLALHSCPWLAGFRDHQTDYYRVRTSPPTGPRE